MSMASSLVAVDSAKARISGGIVFWRMRGTLNIDKLVHAWDGAGLDHDLLPNPTTPLVALKRTAEALADDEQNTRVRPIRGAGTEQERGYVLVREEADARGRPTYSNGLELRFDAKGDLVIAPYTQAVAERVASEFMTQIRTLTQVDVSSWLVRLVRSHKATPLRDTGGIYFVPAGTPLDSWRRYAHALSEVSACTLFEIPALHSDSAVNAVLDSLREEVSAEVAKVAERVREATSDESADARKAALAKVDAKIAAYEAALGVSILDLREQMERVRAMRIEDILGAF